MAPLGIAEFLSYQFPLLESTRRGIWLAHYPNGALAPRGAQMQRRICVTAMAQTIYGIWAFEQLQAQFKPLEIALERCEDP